MRHGPRFGHRGGHGPVPWPEITDETAEPAGGGIAVPVSHLGRDQARALVERIDAEQGTLGVPVDDIWGGEPPFSRTDRLWEA